MERMKCYEKIFIAEEKKRYSLEYSLLIQSAEQGKIYGAGIEKKDETGNLEKEDVLGMCGSRKEAEQFIFRLAEGLAFPEELVYLCDDYIFERENECNHKMMQAVSWSENKR